MKSNTAFFNTLMLAAPLTLWLQASPPAQASQQASPQPTAPDADAATATNRQNVDFFFAGGTPWDFVAAVEKQYKVDWAKVADIPPSMAEVVIPRLRMNRQSAEHILAPRGFGRMRGGGGGGLIPPGGGESDHSPLDALIALYNSLHQAKPELGELIVEGDLTRPSVVIFRSNSQPTSPVDYSNFKMKAFALKGIPENEWGKLEEVVGNELNTLAELQIERPIGERHSGREKVLMDEEIEQQRHSRVALYKDTGLLIVRGPDSILEAAESLVTAWREKQPGSSVK